MQWCVTTAEERENIMSCLRDHITGDNYDVHSDDDACIAFTVDCVDNVIRRTTRQLLLQLSYDPHTNAYVWQAYKMTTLPRIYQDQCFMDKNNMIAELIVLLNRLGFPTPPQMW